MISSVWFDVGSSILIIFVSTLSLNVTSKSVLIKPLVISQMPLVSLAAVAVSSSFKLDILGTEFPDKEGRGVFGFELEEFRRLAESVAILPRARIALPVF